MTTAYDIDWPAVLANDSPPPTPTCYDSGFGMCS